MPRRPSSRRRASGAGAARKAVELSIAAPQVIAMRLARIAAAGVQPTLRDREEMLRMGTEKVEAFSEALVAMSAEGLKMQQEWALAAASQCWNLWLAPWSAWGRQGVQHANGKRQQRGLQRVVDAGLTPIHRRATGNARRLGRSKKR